MRPSSPPKRSCKLPKKRKTKKRKKFNTAAAHAIDGVPFDDPGAPEEGSDAGSVELGRTTAAVARVRAYRTEANRQFARARRLLGYSHSGADTAARSALDRAARAFWWSEDTPLEDEQHQLMHKIGRWTRRNLGCELHFDGSGYVQRCPVAIAHKRFGTSIGFTAKRICSLCDQDLSECEHLQDRMYWVRGGPQGDTPCRVCLEASCSHRTDRLYRARVVSIVKDVEALRELSLVRRPAFPEARLTELPAVPAEEFVKKFGPEFRPGMEVVCDQCLGQCSGFDELPDGDEIGPRAPDAG